jgi:hypothetical protein
VAFQKLNELSCHLEFNDELKEKIKSKYKEKLDNKIEYTTDIFYKDKIYKKSYKTDINQLSYNNKKMIIETWNKIGEIINEIFESDSDSVSTLKSNNSDSDSDSN